MTSLSRHADADRDAMADFVRRTCWLLALTVGMACAALHLKGAFATEFSVSDDARQHVFWTARYADPRLFPHDAIADYFQSIAPLLYRLIYVLPVRCGLDPLTWSKILPALVGIGSGLVYYRLAAGFFVTPPNATRWQRYRPALTALLATVLFYAALWSRDDIASATPRAFFPLLFPAFFGAWMYGRRGWALVCLALLGLVYPGTVLICLGLVFLGLVSIRFGPQTGWLPRLEISRSGRDWRFALAALAVAACTLGPFSWQTTAYKPVLKAAEARHMPELAMGGRSVFFNADPVEYWLNNGRSGLSHWPLRPKTLWLGLALPLAVVAWRRFPTRTRNGEAPDALPPPDTLDARVLPALARLAVVSLGLFFAAHLLLFRLHLPNRYTDPVLRVVLPSMTALVVILVGEGLWRWAHAYRNPSPGRRVFVWALLVSLTGWLTVHTVFGSFARPDFPRGSYVVGTQAALYRYLRTQGPETRVATLSEEGGFLPVFAQRGVLVDREFAIPYHLGYYRPFRENVLALLAVHYTEDAAALAAFAETRGVTHFLVDRQAFDPAYLERTHWLSSYQPGLDTARVMVRGQQEGGRRCILAELAEGTPVFRSERFALVSVEAIRAAAESGGRHPR